MNHRKLATWLLAAVLIGICSCASVLSSPPTGALNPPSSRPTPPFNCTQDPPGLSLRVIEAAGAPDPKVTPPPPPAFLQQIRVEGQGFVPGEDVSISAVAVAGSGRSGGGQGGGMKVNADGSFVWGPIGMAADTTVEWVVSVVHQQRLTFPPAGQSDQNPAFSPDGMRLVFTRFENGYNLGPAGPPTCDYASVQAAVDAAGGSDVIKVAAGAYTDMHSRPSPSGYGGLSIITQLVYISKTVTIQGGYTVGNEL